jgi:hypothetical protein
MADKEATIQMQVTLSSEVVAPLKKRTEATGRSIEEVIAETLVW